VTVFGYVGLHIALDLPGASRGHASFAALRHDVSANYPLVLAGLYVFVDLLGVPVRSAAPAVTALLFLFTGSPTAGRCARRGDGP